MTYVIAEPCIGFKDLSCVDVCPVDCIHPTDRDPDFEAQPQLYIDPEECIDCSLCAEACPVGAIAVEAQVPAKWRPHIAANAAYFQVASTESDSVVGSP